MTERKTLSRGILLTPSQDEQLNGLAVRLGISKNAVVCSLIEHARVEAVTVEAPVATLYVDAVSAAGMVGSPNRDARTA